MSAIRAGRQVSLSPMISTVIRRGPHAALILALALGACGAPPPPDSLGVTESAATTPTFVQRNSAVPQSTPTTVTVAYTAAEVAGDLNVVVVGWNDSTASVSSVTDSKGNVYQLAVGPTRRTGAESQSIYYAKNVVAATANSNVVTVTFSPAAAFPDIRILAYRGLDPTSPLDVAVGSSGTGATSSSGTIATTNATDLLVGANIVETRTTAAGTGFTSRVITTPDGDIAEDHAVIALGTYSATAPLSPAGQYVMQMVAFRAAGSVADTTPPTAPSNLVATAASMVQINLTWTAATDNFGVTSYAIERCQGAGCTTFAQIGTASGTTFSNMSLTAGTSYSYRVRASDAANNFGPYSNVASATTQAPDTSPPTAPSNLVANGVSTTQINLTWTAATDDVAVASYLLESCAGIGCTNFAQIGVATATSFSNTGLTAGTTVNYRVRATDAAGNLGPYSATATATTQAPDTTPPTAPSNLVANGVSTTQINLTWTAATDDVGVASYLLESCAGGGCTNFAQIGVVTATSFSNTGLTAGTTVNYRVRATDAAGNLGPYSATATGATQPPDTTPPTAPSNLVATTASNSQINLSWTGATDDVGVTSYLIERCLGASCSSFAQVGTSMTTTFGDNGLAAATTYSYRVRASDAAANLGPYSGVASATTGSAPALPPAFVQSNYAVPQTASNATVNVSYTGQQTAGNLNVVVVGWNDIVAQVTSIFDSAGNVYQLAVGPTVGHESQSIYYAKNIVNSGANNVVTVSFSPPAAFPDIRVLEYQGLDPNNPVDATTSGSGSSTLSTTPLIVTSNPLDMIVAANTVATGVTGPGGGYVRRILTVPDTDIVEDWLVASPGSYSVTAPISPSGGWVMQAVAFKASSSVAPPPPNDMTPPAVSMSAPANGATISGAVSVTVNATDSGSGVAGVQLTVDGLSVAAPDTTIPYTIALDTTRFSNGAHTIGAYAFDVAHNIGTATSISVTVNNATAGNPAQNGLWSGTTPLPIVSVNVALMWNGKVLMSEGQSWGADVRVWDPTTSTTISVPTPSNVFCSTGFEQMADGRLMSAGGHLNQADFGVTNVNIFDPSTQTWTVMPEMEYPRWYPQMTTLPDGRQLVLGGEINCDGCNALVPEVYTPSTNTWVSLESSQLNLPFYPHLHVLPDGRVLVSSTARDPIVSQIFDPNALTWTSIGGAAVDGGSASMYLPGKVLKVGTSNSTGFPARASRPTAYVLDTTQPNATWRQVASMSFGRTYHTSTMLPDGNVLVTGGGPTGAPTDTANAVLPAEMWSPTTETWTRLASMSAPRLYHSEALLMPDGRVLISGGGRSDDVSAPTDQFSAEYFSPPYLFKGARPAITSAPTTLQYGQAFTVQTPDAARIANVSIIRFGSVTHTFNGGQHYVPLTFTAGSGSISVTAPASNNLAPPGYYMLFILDTNGVPSTAAIVHF